nr:PREDICTED: cas scaffolding protein family member 4 isoform X1 [Lepisosteus oculatus]
MFKPVKWESWLDSLLTKRIKNLLAKALYDNVAECSDELAFRKGDILMVLEQNVAGSHGWWKCSLHGQQGLAPANRLHLLPPSQAEVLPGGSEVGCLTACADGPPALDTLLSRSPQNIYQIPSAPRQASSPAYEIMDSVYKVPSTPQQAARGLSPSPSRKPSERPGDSPSKACMSLGGMTSCVPRLSCPSKEVYDVPTLSRRSSLFTMPATRPMTRKTSLFTTRSELQQTYEILESAKDSAANVSNVYAVPPSVHQDPCYDIPTSLTDEAQKRLAGGYSTLPNPRKSEWIYDVPVTPEKQDLNQESCSTLPTKGPASGRQLFYDTLPARIGSPQNPTLTHSLYDIPKPSTDLRQPQGNGSPPDAQNKGPVYKIFHSRVKNEGSFHLVPPTIQEQVIPRYPSDALRGHVPTLRRGMPGPMNDLPHGFPGREEVSSGSHPLYDVPTSRDSLLQGGEEDREAPCVSGVDSQRSSTVSTSSTSSTSSASSCDSAALSSSSPEPVREVTLTQEEASKRLVELQEAVCRAVSRLMVFVSSLWRSREHLSVHLEEVRSATEDIAGSLTDFMSFAADVRGNARRLTDANLQGRLHKQLAIVVDSGLILREAERILKQDGWRLDTLAQDPSQATPPDQLDRFVMVARTVPEDVKRLVSILNANGKLLFRPSQKEADTPTTISESDKKKKIFAGCKETSDSGGEDNDYVQLQRKEEFEQQRRLQLENKRSKLGSQNSSEQQVEPKKTAPCSPRKAEEKQKIPYSEHCKLYFGALQKAISVFIGSLVEGQPPEKFIAHSKLVIMVGQKLVNTLCREAHSRDTNQDLLCKSNHLCALLKQLAVATKKAAVHFPEKIALQEAQDFAKELAHRAQHFRTMLEL